MTRCDQLQAEVARFEAQKAVLEAERVLGQDRVGRGDNSPHRPRPAGVATGGPENQGSNPATRVMSWLSIWKDFDFEQVGEELGAKELCGYVDQVHGDLREVTTATQSEQLHDKTCREANLSILP